MKTLQVKDKYMRQNAHSDTQHTERPRYSGHFVGNVLFMPLLTFLIDTYVSASCPSSHD